MKLFLKYIKNKRFSKQKSNFIQKSRLFFKNEDMDNKKLMISLIIAGGSLLFSQEHMKERRKRRQWVRPWIRKTDKDFRNYHYLK